MKFQETPLKGAFIIDIDRLEDERGFFAEGWKKEDAAAYGIGTDFNRTNISFNRKKDTLRGLHSQKEPHSEIKLVRCNRGAIYDVIVDIRSDSATYGQWFGIEITAESHRLLYIPRGFLHGFQTLEDNTEVFYQVAGHYKPDMEIGVRFDDPAFNIQWPAVDKPADRTLSPKDQTWQPFTPLVPTP
jgi:dTDP-4-dehydrorhamnose 3,5-epimerase